MGEFPEKMGGRKEGGAERTSTWFMLVEIVFQMLQIKNVTIKEIIEKLEGLPEWSGWLMQSVW